MKKYLELVHHGSNRYSVISTSEFFYQDIEPDLPEHLRQIEESCHVGDYTIFPEGFSIEEFLNWCNEQGISVIINSSIYNPKYRT